MVHRRQLSMPERRRPPVFVAMRFVAMRRTVRYAVKIVVNVSSLRWARVAATAYATERKVAIYAHQTVGLALVTRLDFVVTIHAPAMKDANSVPKIAANAQRTRERFLGFAETALAPRTRHANLVRSIAIRVPSYR